MSLFSDNNYSIEAEGKSNFYRPAVSSVKKYWQKKIVAILKKRNEAAMKISLLLGISVVGLLAQVHT